MPDTLLAPDAVIADALVAGVWRVNPHTGIVSSGRSVHERILGTRNLKGYLVATLHFRGRRVQVKLHRVVWIAMNGSIPVGLMPDHINRNKSDNRIANLRLVSNKENAANRRSYLGEENPAAKITRNIAMAIRNASGSYDTRATQFGVSKSLVAQISRGELWQ